MMNSSNIKKRSLRIKTVQRLYEISNNCFRLAADDILIRHKLDKHISVNHLTNQMHLLRHPRLGINTQTTPIPNIKSIADEVDERYRELLCSLKTSDIEDMILADDLGLAPRAGITLEALKDELARRMILNDKRKPDRRVYKVK